MQRKIERNIGDLYPAEAISYKCDQSGSLVNLIALWYLDTDMGCDSLMAMSSKVVCSNAAKCTSLKNGNCPLTIGYGEVMNKIGVKVMCNETPIKVKFKGQVLFAESSRSLSTGQYIWFGKTQIFCTVTEALI
jgi:hypothetical protein